MITAAIEIDGKPVGSGVFVVLPRVGEYISVRIHTETEDRLILGRVRAIRHHSVVLIKGNELKPEASVTLALEAAEVS